MDQVPEQTAFVERPLGPGLLLGACGSGKTSCLRERAAYLVESGQLGGEGSFLVLVPGALARADVIRRGGGLVSGRNTMTFDEFSEAIVVTLLDRKPDGMYLGAAAHRALAEVEGGRAAAGLRLVPGLRGARALLVDDAQELTGTQYRLVAAVAGAVVELLDIGGDVVLFDLFWQSL